MDQIAIISDIHGNLEALKVALADIEARGIRHIYCLGDIIAKGTHFRECIDLLRENCEIVLQGNCDDIFSRDLDLDGRPPLAVKRIRWNQEKLTAEDKEYLRSLPFAHEIYMSGRLVRLFHSSPEKNDAYIGGIDSYDRIYGMFLPTERTPSQERADIAIYGHIHLPFIQKLYNRVLINPGSVGNAIDCIRDPERDGDVRVTAVVNYAILRGELDSRDWNAPLSYELVCLPYDIEKELSGNGDNIEFDDYAKELRLGWYRDMAKVYRMAKERKISF